VRAELHVKQLPLPIALRPEPDFDNFVAGANANASALAHLRELPVPAAPVYLWGPSGSGKTHLLRALSSQCRGRGQRAGWFDAADAQPWTVSPEWTLVVIDRCEALRPDAQHAAFAVFVDAALHGVQVAAAGRLPPVDLPVRDDLRTRLAWGHVFALAPLSDDEARAALRRAGDRRGLLLPDEVLDHLLRHCPRDMAHLMDVLDRLDDFAMSCGRRATLPLLRQMLATPEHDEVGAS
jgi:DnaA family protein